MCVSRNARTKRCGWHPRPAGHSWLTWRQGGKRRERAGGAAWHWDSRTARGQGNCVPHESPSHLFLPASPREDPRLAESWSSKLSWGEAKEELEKQNRQLLFAAGFLAPPRFPEWASIPSLEIQKWSSAREELLRPRVYRRSSPRPRVYRWSSLHPCVYRRSSPRPRVYRRRPRARVYTGGRPYAHVYTGGASRPVSGADTALMGPISTHRETRA